MSTLEPGWYADPAERASFRWWDGSAWTRWLSGSAEATAPTGDPAVAGPTSPPRPAPPDAGASDTAATDTAVGIPVAVAVLIGAVLLALLAVGGVVALNTQRLPSGPSVDPPAPTPTMPVSPVTFDATTRAASVGELRATLAAAPFSCAAPEANPGLFSSAVVCEAAVHSDYDAQGEDWYATQIFGVLDASVVDSDDLSATMVNLDLAILSTFYTDQKTTVRKRKVSKLVGIAPNDRALLQSEEVHYRVKGVPSTYDKVVIGLFHLADGEYATWLAAKPNDAAKKVGTVLDASADTVDAKS